MFTTFLKGITGFFERHFLIAAFFPTLLFVALNVGMVLLNNGINTLISWWGEQSPEYQTVLVITILGGTLVVAYLTSIFQPTLTRLFEGYWPNIPLLSGIAQRRRTYYQSIWQYLTDEVERANKTVINVDQADDIVALKKEWEELRSQFDTVDESKRGALEKEIKSKKDAFENLERERLSLIRANRRPLERELRLFFPFDKGMILPTRLGNILRAAEAYGLKRYGLDAVVIWPRLYGVLPDPEKKLLSHSKTNLDLFIGLTVLLAVFALYWQISSLILVNWLLFFLASFCWVLLIICYKAALQAALTYSEVVKSTIDLHRWALLKALHLKIPTSYKEELAIWDEVSDHFYRGYPLGESRYDTAKEPKPKEKPANGVLEKIVGYWKKWRVQEWSS